MGDRDPRVDEYIERSAEFARPVLARLREAVHAACPEAREAIKWGHPHFEYRGLLCNMASFKQHCAFGFWKGDLVMQNAGTRSREAMGHFGRLTSVDDLPPDQELAGYIREAMRLNEEGVKSPARAQPKARKAELPPPEDLLAALRESPAAQANFEAFPPSHRREYVEWITEARTDATRKKRIDTAVEWIGEGKQRNWKYVR